MELSYMLNQMCHEALSNADVNAIRKARGFTKSETENRSQFESFFLSNIGLEAAMRVLTPEEVAALHLLNRKTEEVDLTFFERVYGSARREDRYFYGTFTQLYKDTFKAVKQNLLRRGIMMMAEDRARLDNTKMERWRFRFHPAFAAYLPPLIPAPRYFDTPGEDRCNEGRREKVLDALGLPSQKPFWQKEFKSVVASGHFKLGQEPFSVKRLSEWQESAWTNRISVTMPNKGGQSVHPVKAIRIILGTLAPGEWVTLDQLALIYDVFCFGVNAPPLREICEAGWTQGGLAHHIENHTAYYRLPLTASHPVETITPETYLEPTSKGEALRVDLQTIPFDALETLNRLAHLKVEKHQLVATPSQVKLGRAALEIRESPLGIWLSTQIPAFGKAFDLIAENWGKTIVHTDLLIAQIKNLSLRVQLERQLADDLVLLSDKYVAFPVESRRTVEKIVQKGGFVVKTVKT
jgi:hypothetical protein